MAENFLLPCAPYSFGKSGSDGGNGHYNLYVSDGSGRKIAGVYGKRGEQEVIARGICALPVLIEAALTCIKAGEAGVAVPVGLLRSALETLD